MTLSKFLACALALMTGAAHAQDPRRVVSPDGKLEFRLFTAVPEGSIMNCLAYQVWLRGKLLLDTSYLGLNIHFQEPLLGENVGLSADKVLHGADYNGLFADYLQTSSTGRRIQLEVRVWNDGAAFRYTVPQSALLRNLLIEDDVTQFHFAESAAGGRPEQAPLPYFEQQPGVGWIGIYESLSSDFPRMYLVRGDADTMLVRLPERPNDPGVAFDGVTPWTSPWRIVAVAANRRDLDQTDVVRELDANQKNR